MTDELIELPLEVIDTTLKPTNPKDLIGCTKPNIALLPTAGVIHAALCMQDGAKKYGPFNWRDPNQKVGYMAYLSAAYRHLLAYTDREEVASDSKHNHLGHAIAGLMVLLDAIECENAIDDRPTKGVAYKLLGNNTQKVKD